MNLQDWEARKHRILLGLTGNSSRVVNGTATVKEALRQSELDWEVTLEQINRRPNSVFRHIVKEDPHGGQPRTVIGSAPPGYTPVQNRELFGLLDPLIRTGAATYSCAGELALGRTVWVMASLRQAAEVAGDKIYPYVLLINSHSGTGSQLQVRLTPLRVICGNMIEAAKTFGVELKIDHDAVVEEKVRQAAEVLMSLGHGFSTTVAQCRRMAAVPAGPRVVREYLAEVFPESASQDAENRFSVLELRRQAFSLFELGVGNSAPAVRGTVWAAYNGVTELVDHHVPDLSLEDRLQRLWFGAGRRMKRRAFSIAVDLVERLCVSTSERLAARSGRTQELHRPIPVGRAENGDDLSTDKWPPASWGDHSASVTTAEPALSR